MTKERRRKTPKKMVKKAHSNGVWPEHQCRLDGGKLVAGKPKKKCIPCGTPKVKPYGALGDGP